MTVILAPTLPATPLEPGSLSDGGKSHHFRNDYGRDAGSAARGRDSQQFQHFSFADQVTVAAGIPASYTVTVTPTGNIPNTVTLSASGAPTGGTTYSQWLLPLPI